MFNFRTIALVAAIIAGSASAPTDAAGASSERQLDQAAPEQVVINGTRPGPGLWKVSKGEHVLWVFGTYAPLPEAMQWRSQQVEATLAGSQEFLAAPTFSTRVGPMKALTAVPFLIGIKNSPNGARLEDQVPPDVYARWQALKRQYIGENSAIERERPIFAAEELHRRAMAHAGLTSTNNANRAIEKLAAKHQIKRTGTYIDMPTDNLGARVRDFKKRTFDDTGCFIKTIAQIETDLDAMRIRAHAWAIGDLDEIRKLHFEREEECTFAAVNSVLLDDPNGLQAIKARLRDMWLEHAERTLANNKSTFAALPITDIIDPNGYLALLRARGYTVENPQ